jgi:hypothetical protein
MKIFVLRSTTTLVLMVLLTTTRSLAAQAERPGLLMSRQPSFVVPFSVAPTSDPSQAPREVFLYVSTDRGVHWQLAGRTNPAARRFHVRAQTDGEHWFLVRTLSQAGQLSPTDVTQPGLRVMIDSAKPDVQLISKRSASGDIYTEYLVRDANLDRQQIQIEYQTAAARAWQPVPGMQRANGDDPQTLQGSGTWQPVGSPDKLTVRVRATDRAGNEAMAQSLVAGDTQSLVAGDTQSLVGGGSEFAQTWSPQITPALPTSVSNTPAADATSASRSLAPHVASGSSTPWPADQQSHVPLAPGTALDELQSQNTNANAVDGLADSATDSEPTLPTSSVHRPLTVHKTSFDLPYRPELAGTGGLLKADLWGTSDAGRNWTYYGTDVDRQSPFHVTVPNTGLYGFLIRLHPRGGARPLDPKPGDLPNIWVLVQED